MEGQQQNGTPSESEKTLFKYYVSLDLGSASTAAFFQAVGGQEDTREMVRLQAYARELLGEEPRYYTSGGTISSRLQTRFVFNEFRQPAPLPVDHALLDFVDDRGMRRYEEDEDGNVYEYYERESIFQYFQPRFRNEELTERRMPNPKIPFQMGGREVIIPLGLKDAPSYERHRYEPAELIKHMTLQILRNFVLRSPELREIYQREPEQIHLTLTVPNVYSLTHAQDIVTFVRDHLDVGAVDFLFESDAVAYAFLSHNLETTPDATRLKILGKLGDLRDQERRLITIDIGRGTTDLSLIRLLPKESDDPVIGPKTWHCVLARTGRSDGGNKLSYLFARYYDARLKEEAAWFREQTGRELPFDFLNTGSEEGLVGAFQRVAIDALEQLIEDVKKNMEPGYKVMLKEAQQAEHIRALTKHLLAAIDPQWEADNADKADAIYQHLTEVLTLPEGKALAPRIQVSPKDLLKGFRFLRRGMRLDEEPESLTPLDELAQSIHQYVQDAIALFGELETIAREREDITDKRVRIFDPKNTFVLVAGQASQFLPLQHAIQSYCAGRGLMTQFLEQDEAKEACCRGAVSYHLSRYHFENPDEIHGTYGFISEAASDRIRLVPTADLKAGKPMRVQVDSAAIHTLIYLTHPAEAQDILTKHKGYVARISRFEPRYGPLKEAGAEGEAAESGYYFEVVYIREQTELRINDQPVREIGNFGLLTQDIYEKVWPDILRPLTVAT